MRTLLPVLARFHTSGQFSNAFHLHIGNLPFQSIVLSGRQSNEKNLESLKTNLNCETVEQLVKVVSPANKGSHFGLQLNIFVMLLLTQA